MNLILDQTEQEDSFIDAIQTLLENNKLAETPEFEKEAKIFVDHLQSADISIEEALEKFAMKVGGDGFNLITDFSAKFDTEFSNQEIMRKISIVLKMNL